MTEQVLPNVDGPTEIEGYTLIKDADAPRFIFEDGEFKRVAGGRYVKRMSPEWSAAPFELCVYRKNGSMDEFIAVMFRRIENPL